MIKHSFELRVKRSEEKLILELYELPPIEPRDKETKGVLLSSVDEADLPPIQNAVARALRNSSYSIVDVKRTRRAPFKLTEEDGIRLDLVFRGTKGISKRSRVEDIVNGIQAMGREEAYYWHAKVTRGTNRENWNGLKALRILMAGE